MYSCILYTPARTSSLQSEVLVAYTKTRRQEHMTISVSTSPPFNVMPNNVLYINVYILAYVLINVYISSIYTLF